MIGMDFYRTRFSRETWAALKPAFDPGFAGFFDEILAAREAAGEG